MSISTASKKSRGRPSKFAHQEGLTVQQIKIVEKTMQFSKKWSWKAISNMIFDKCNRRLAPPIIRAQWIKMIEEQKPTKEQIAEYLFNLLDQKKWFKYDDAAQEISQGPFKYCYYARYFMKKVWMKTVRDLQFLAKQVLGLQNLKISLNDLTRIADFLMTSQSRLQNLLTPQILRYYLLLLYLTKLRKTKIGKSKIRSGFYFLKKLKQQVLCQKTCEVLNNKSWAYVWSAEELNRSFQLYCQYGKNFNRISKLMLIQFGQKQKFNASIIRSLYEKYQRNGLLKAKQFLKQNDIKQTDFKCNSTLRNACNFVLGTNHQYFHTSVKLMSVAFGKKYDVEQIVAMMTQLHEIMIANLNAYYFKGQGKAMSDYTYEA